MTRACEGNEYQKNICCEKKPYFMIYRYEEERKKYKDFIKQHNMQCVMDFGIDIETLLKTPTEQLTQEQLEAIHWFNVFNPVDMGMCTINRICFYIENKIGEYKAELKERDFDWEQFKVKRRCTQEHKDRLLELMNIYTSHNQSFLDQYKQSPSTTPKPRIDFVEQYIISRATEICPNDDERWNIILDICNEIKDVEQKDYCWIILVDILTRREENSGKINI